MMDEQDFAHKVVKVLDSGLPAVDSKVAAQLATARRRAVAEMDHLHVGEMQLAGWGRLIEFSHHGGYRFWLPVLLLLAALTVALGSVLTTHNNDPIDADALLLASDLPPEAYADKEFVAWLEQSSQL